MTNPEPYEQELETVELDSAADYTDDAPSPERSDTLD